MGGCSSHLPRWAEGGPDWLSTLEDQHTLVQGLTEERGTGGGTCLGVVGAEWGG